MVRLLSKELQKKAIEELLENPDRVEADIRHIQEWIKQQPHLNAPSVLYVLPLPYSKNFKGPKIILIRFQNYDTNTMNIQTITTVLYMILNILMVEDDNYVISGLLLCKHLMPIMVRPLTKELQKKAIDELNEDPEILEEDIKTIQEWIKQQPHLYAPTDKQWILSFLRGCKFSHQKTKYKFDMFYAAKSSMPEITRPRNIYSTEIQTLLKSGIINPLPYTKNYKGPKVILFQFKNCDTNIITVENMSALFYMMLTTLMVEDDNVIISGDLFWVDMTHFPLSFFLQLNPTFLKHFFFCIQSVLPVRMKGIHITGSPALAEKALGIIKAYMAPKLRERLFVYSDSTFKDIYKIIPKSHMPKDYGGGNSKIEDIAAYWMDRMKSYSTWFKENDQYITNETLRPGKPIAFDNVIGIDGSFRKLSID